MAVKIMRLFVLFVLFQYLIFFATYLLVNCLALKVDKDKGTIESDNNAPCINIINVAEQSSRSPQSTQSTTGISAYFLARAHAKSHETSPDEEETPGIIEEGIGKYCNFFIISLI